MTSAEGRKDGAAAVRLILRKSKMSAKYQLVLRKNNQMIFAKQSSLIVIGVVLFAISCSDNSSVNGPEESKKIETQKDADKVALSLRFQLIDAAPYYSEKIWENEKVNGSVSGYAIVNGEYEELSYSEIYTRVEVYIYKNVRIVCHDYCSDSGDPHLTGTATINGSLKYTMKNYTGGWVLKGSMTLTGAYECSVSFSLSLLEKYEYSGTITSDGTSWSVNSD